MDTYLGLTKEQWEDIYKYDATEGKVYSVNSGVLVGSPTSTGLIVKKRLENKVVTVYLGKLCYFLIHGKIPDRRFFIRYKDNDIHNLKPDNLVVTNEKQHGNEFYYAGRQEVVPVDRFIVYNPNSNQYIVRRGTNQAIYRTFSLEEAISIRNEWESDNSIHKWDSFSGKYREYL